MSTGSFGNNLKNIRKQMGMTQNQLGRLAGMGQVTIANYENGRRFPGEDNLKTLSRVLSVSLDLLLGLGRAPERGEFLFSGSVPEMLDLLLHDSFAASCLYLKRWRECCTYSLMQVYTEIMTPLLHLTGELWARGELSVAQEHLVSGFIRELIIRSSGEAGKPPVHKGVWLGLCAPGEEHDLGLLMNSLLVRESGWKSVNLGTQVPFSDLVSMIGSLSPDVLCFSVTMEKNLNGLSLYLDTLNQIVKRDLRIIVSGRAAGGRCFDKYSGRIRTSSSLEESVGLCISEEWLDP